MKFYFLLLLSVMLLTLASCSSESTFKEDKTFLGKYEVKAKTLSLGKQVYLEYCMACHGIKGDGNGPASKGSIPTPRNFTQGLYKFGLVKDGGLPTDDDFKRIIQKGLHGTAMLTWDISDEQTYAVTQYIKTFAPAVWENKDGVVGEELEYSKDPYTVARSEYAITKGKEIYHAVASCQTCHRAFVSKSELSQLNLKYNGESLTEFEDNLYMSKLQDSEYYFADSKDRTAKYLPPDFTYDIPRSATTVEELYKRLKAGVTGTSMAPWDGTLEEDQIWAVAYYVRSLMDLRDTPERAKLMKELE